MLPENNVCVVANDTDIFTLLIAKAAPRPGDHCLYLRQDASKELINISTLLQHSYFIVVAIGLTFSLRLK